jgi:hypothetical protein
VECTRKPVPRNLSRAQIKCFRAIRCHRTPSAKRARPVLPPPVAAYDRSVQFRPRQSRIHCERKAPEMIRVARPVPGGGDADPPGGSGNAFRFAQIITELLIQRLLNAPILEKGKGVKPEKGVKPGSNQGQIITFPLTTPTRSPQPTMRAALVERPFATSTVRVTTATNHLVRLANAEVGGLLAFDLAVVDKPGRAHGQAGGFGPVFRAAEGRAGFDDALRSWLRI